MPKTRKRPNNKQIDIGAPLATTVAAERDVKIFPEPGGQGRTVHPYSGNFAVGADPTAQSEERSDKFASAGTIF